MLVEKGDAVMEKLAELKMILEGASNIVFFGGAGVSTESGIPDFRSESGIYATVKQYGCPPEVILSHTFFMEHPDVFYRFYRSQLVYRDARPNAAHRALAALEERGRLKAVVTQNIDGLHQKAGSRTVVELHGSVHRNYCMACHAYYDLDYVLDGEGVPRCPCGGIIRPDVVLYEEELDPENIMLATRFIRDADTLIVGGTSLAVDPAASLVHWFKSGKVILINKSKTPYDGMADLVIHEPIGEVLGGVV